MLSVLAFKKQLFAGVLDGGETEVFMQGTRLSKFMESVEKVSSAVGEVDVDPISEVPACCRRPRQWTLRRLMPGQRLQRWIRPRPWMRRRHPAHPAPTPGPPFWRRVPPFCRDWRSRALPERRALAVSQVSSIVQVLPALRGP